MFMLHLCFNDRTSCWSALADHVTRSCQAGRWSGTIDYICWLCLMTKRSRAYVSILFFWRRYFKRGSLNLLNLTGILLISTGLFTTQMHSTYVAIGFVFLIPMLFTQIDFKEFNKRYLYSFLALLLLNFIVVVFFGNLGVSSFWK